MRAVRVASLVLLGAASLAVGADVRQLDGPEEGAAAPNPEWARAPTGAASRNADGLVVEEGATGPQARFPGATGATGVFQEKDSQTAITKACDGCGVEQDKPGKDGKNPRPILQRVSQVLHPAPEDDDSTAYNATADYSGKGTPVSGTWDAAHAASSEKCCRVCPPAKECKDKDGCFHKCKRVCGNICEMPAPDTYVDPCAAPDATDDCGNKVEEVPLKDITPAMAKAVANAPAEHKVEVIKKLLRGEATPCTVNCESEKYKKAQAEASAEASVEATA